MREARGEAATDPSPQTTLASKLGAKQRIKELHADDIVPGYNEVRRIVNLPVSAEMTEQELETFSRDHLLAPAYDDGFRFFPVQAQAIRDYQIYGGGFFPIAVGWGKCVCASTEIFDVASGCRRSVAEIGKVTVPSMREHDHRIQARPATVFESGKKPCVRLQLRHGQQMELSADHKVYTQQGWVEAGNLTTEDRVATPCTLPHPYSPSEATDEEVILAAYLMADGSMSENATTFAMSFTQMPGEVLDEFKRVVPVVGGETRRSANDASSGKAQQWNIRGLRPWARALKLQGKATDKRLPAAWYGLSDKHCALFLSRFWACDGWLEQDRAAVCLANRLLVEDIRHLLLRLGITSRVEYKPIGEFTSWRLVVSGGSNLDRFAGALGDIPGKPWGSLKTRPSKAVGYDGDLRWVPVQSVEDIGIQQVYDLNVPETHNFVANGVVVHNTLLSLAVSHYAYVKGKSKIVLLVPPNVLEQLVSVQIPEARCLIPMGFPIFVLGGKAAARRRKLAKSGRPGLYIIPYSLLSSADAVETIKSIKPDVIVGDEIHSVGRRSAARTKRLFDYINNNNPELVGMSGTITAKGVLDYWHIIKAALGDNSPLPLSSNLASEWASVIDSDSNSIDNRGDLSESASGPLMPLVDWARRNFPDEEVKASVPGFRKAYRLRLNSAPGVVSSGLAEIGTSLTLHNESLKDELEQAEGHGKLKELIAGVEELWETPNGDEIEHAIHTWKWMFELSAGFYNQLTWPGEKEYAERKNISEAEAAEVLTGAKYHHEAGQEYASLLRKFLEASPPEGMDTPMLVGGEFSRHPDDWAHNELYQAWAHWHRQDFEGRPDRDSTAVRVCDYKIVAALSWAASLPRGRGGIVWYHHQEIGKWAKEYMVDAGLDVLHCPAGNAHNKSIIDHANKGKIVIASISAHGTGKNLQHFQEQYFLQWPRSPKTAEQGLGRTHRNGQLADELIVHTNNTIEFDRLNFAACLNDALYIHQTTGNRQKLIYCNYDPLPKVFPYMVLQERGLQAKRLDAEAKKLMENKFHHGGAEA